MMKIFKRLSKIGIYSIISLSLALIIYIISNATAEKATKDYPSVTEYKEVPYTTFKKHIKNKDIDVVYYNSNYKQFPNIFGDGKIKIKTQNPTINEFYVYMLNNDMIIRDVALFNTKESIVESRNMILNIFYFILIFPIIFLYLNSFLHRFNMGVYINGDDLEDGSSNKSISLRKHKDDKVLNKNTKTFNDIAGLHEVKKDITSLVDFLKNKKKYEKVGAKLPKGVILYGPPGTGKTLLAKAVANEAGVPFFYMSGSDFIEKLVGVGAKRVRELFDKARKNSPCIVFIDEIDTIGSKRSSQQHSEDRKTINALLTEMDGFKESDGIIVIGATNRLEDLDSALTRPGRFTDKFCVSLPETPKERLEVLNMYCKNKNIGDDIDLDALSKELIGFSPAKIEALLNEAAIISVQRGKGYITKSEIDSAMYKILLNGHEREDQSERDKNELNVVAWHEAGHALIGKICGKEVTKVTIISSTSGAGGVTFSTPRNNTLHSLSNLKDEVMELYGGRIAEYIYFNEDKSKITTGASNDIERATSIIDNIVTKYGFLDKFGMINMETANVNRDYILKEKIKLAKDIEQMTYNLLKSNVDVLKRIAESLMENETITGDELDALIYA